MGSTSTNHVSITSVSIARGLYILLGIPGRTAVVVVIIDYAAMFARAFLLNARSPREQGCECNSKVSV